MKFRIILAQIPMAVLLTVVSTFATLSADEINYKTLYQSSAPGVVFLYGTDGKAASSGTGSIIDSKGLVLTNTHVVTHKGELWKEQYIILKPEKITGNVNNDLKRVFSCKVLALNPTFDLALVQIINPPQNLKALSLSDLSQVGIGEPTVAIGHPGGGAPWSLTTGKISASFENYGNSKGWDVFQTETSLNPGNSGGPLLDGSGAIIGVNTFIIRKSDSGLALTGLNFAVKSSTVRYWIREIIGQLPTVSEVSKSRQEKPTEPSGEDIEKATPPAPEKKAPKAFVEKGKEKRDSELPKSPEKEKAYTSKIEPGKVYGGKDLDSFLESYKKEYQDFRQQQQVEYKEFLKSKR